MIIIASVSIASGIVLTLVNTKFSIKTLFGSSWGYAILTGATISVFIYTHILIQNRRSRTTTTTAAVSSSLIPSTSISLRKNNKNTINNNNSQKRKISKRFIPWLLFISLTITVALMVYASHGFF
jgi:disulfide bond formation protein DsbB